ncbi:MAG: metallophosphoesterase [Candidatus Melainabacteria bacterium]|nr:metallophosphoesterase [Candidatus Melainabacteria bacterium]
MQKTITIVQLSDMHLYKDSNLLLNNSNPHENFKLALKNISGLATKPDLLFLTGDLSQDASVESYQELKNILETTGLKYSILVGNHDDMNAVNKVFHYNWTNETVDSSFVLNEWLIYCLNTSRYPQEAGFLSKTQLEKLTNTLEVHKSKNAIIFLHHQPVLVNSLWIDKMALRNSVEFNQVIQKYGNVKAVLFGHIHHVFEKTANNIFYASCPSTVYQVVANNDNFKVDKRIPGYRLIKLNESGFESEVIWVNK